MAIARASGQTQIFALANPATSVAASFAQNVVSGNAVMCFTRGDNTAAGTYPDDHSVSDNMGVGNSYGKDVTLHLVDENRCSVLACDQLQGGGACQLTFSSSGDGASRRVLGAMEYSGLNNAILDTTKSATGSGTSVSSGNFSTAENEELLFGGVGDTNTNSPYSPGSGWSELGDGLSERSQFQDQITSASGTYAYTCTGSDGTAGWVTVVAAYKATPSGPGANAPTKGLRGMAPLASAFEDDGRFNDLDIRGWWREALVPA